MHPALKKGPHFAKSTPPFFTNPHFPLFLQKKHPSFSTFFTKTPTPIAFPAYQPGWVSQNLSAHDRHWRVASSQELLGSYTSDKELFCSRLVTKRGFIIGPRSAN